MIPWKEREASAQLGRARIDRCPVIVIKTKQNPMA
jgi:hypothetical protein